MAVEARHRNLFPSQSIGNREAIRAIEASMNLYNNSAIGYGLPPLSGTTTGSLIPMYNSGIAADSFPLKTAVKADSGLTYAPHLPVSRKRSRESINPLISHPYCQIQNQDSNRCGSLTFLGEDVSLQIQQQQFEMDRLVAQHMDKMRLEMEERRKRYSKRIIAAVEEGISKRLRAKDEEIEKIGKINWALEEKVKSLYMENQVWRDLAQTNEATANALRCNLEQVLAAQVKDENGILRSGGDAAALADDAQSCCGSNCTEVGEEGECRGGGGRKRSCRHCGAGESCVLLLPCRHLCLCTVCGSSVHTCPVCKTAKTASVHVIMPS